MNENKAELKSIQIDLKRISMLALERRVVAGRLPPGNKTKILTDVLFEKVSSAVVVIETMLMEGE